MQVFIRRQWFLLGLGLVLGAGFFCHGPLEVVAAAIPRREIVALVLFLMALPLEIGTMWRVMRRPGPALLAVAINFGLLPPVAWAVSMVLPPDLAIGLVIISAIPCTIASVVVWTRRAGGNDAVAILVTMITNLTCFIVTPAWLRLMTQTHVAIDPVDMARRLALIVVLPIFVAQILRLYRPLAARAAEHKVALGVLSQFGILSIIFIGAVGSGAKLGIGGEADAAIGAADWALMLACVVGVHLALLAVGHGLARLFGMERPDRIAVGFGGSQKTLMVGLDIGAEHFPTMPLAMLPMVAYHICQLLVDTLIADRLRRHQESPAAAPGDSSSRLADEAEVR